MNPIGTPSTSAAIDEWILDIWIAASAVPECLDGDDPMTYAWAVTETLLTQWDIPHHETVPKNCKESAMHYQDYSASGTRYQVVYSWSQVQHYYVGRTLHMKSDISVWSPGCYSGLESVHMLALHESAHVLDRWTKHCIGSIGTDHDEAYLQVLRVVAERHPYSQFGQKFLDFVHYVTNI